MFTQILLGPGYEFSKERMTIWHKAMQHSLKTKIVEMITSSRLHLNSTHIERNYKTNNKPTHIEKYV